MKAKSYYQPSETVDALFTTAVVKIKTDTEKTIAKLKAMSGTEVFSAKTEVESKTNETIPEQRSEPEVGTETTIEASAIEPETKSSERAGTNETKSEAEPVSQKETTETFESEAKQEGEAAERKVEDADRTFEGVAEEKEEITSESRGPDAGEVSKSIRQMAHLHSNQPRKQSLTGSGLCAKDVMLKELVWGSPEDSVQHAITKMQQHNSSYLMVGVDGVLEGIVSNSNITGALSPYLRPVFAKWRRPLDDATLQIRIKWIMSRPVHIVILETPLANIMGSMCRYGVLCLPVVDQRGKVQGLVTEAGIFKALLGLKSSTGILVSGDENKRQSASDYREIESTPTMEPDLVAPV